MEDSYVYILEEQHEIVILGLYVDDCLLIGSNSQVIEKAMKELKKHYELIETKEKKFLNIQIRESRKGIELSQTEYIDEILGTHGLQDANPTATPNK